MPRTVTELSVHNLPFAWTGEDLLKHLEDLGHHPLAVHLLCSDKHFLGRAKVDFETAQECFDARGDLTRVPVQGRSVYVGEWSDEGSLYWETFGRRD